MDPVAGIGLAVNIFSMIQLVAEWVHEGRELYSSVDGASKDVHQVESLSSALYKLSLDIVNQKEEAGDVGISPGLRRTARECGKFSKELLSKLDEMKVHHSGKRRKLDSAAKAFKVVWNKREIEKCEERLESMKSSMQLELLYIMRHQHEYLSRRLDSLYTNYSSLQDKSNAAFSKLIESGNSLCKKFESPAFFSEIATLLDSLLAYREEQKTVIRRTRIILDSLRFPEIKAREIEVPAAHERTFEWILTKSDSNTPASNSFVDWLSSPDSGLFWISGKAGSGKSTLMKLLRNHGSTTTSLRLWAKDRELILASHFFWNAGTEIQRSQKGLLQTLLYQVFEQCPEAIDSCLPSVWQVYLEAAQIGQNKVPDWTLSDLLEAFSRLRQQSLKSTAFCFFIDGLDEYHSKELRPFQDLIEVIQNLAKTGSIKICVSSRPWNVFDDAFAELAVGKLCLPHLTENDMRIFVQDNLAASRRFRELAKEHDAYQNLVQDIVLKAEGVFLWVFLVVRSLIRGLANEDSLGTLQRRLEETPPDLEDLFRVIIGRTERVYRAEAYAMLHVCLANKNSDQYMPLILLLFLTEPEITRTEWLTSPPWTEEVFLTKSAICKRRLGARCQDLLEVSDAISPTPGRVDFIHRTVADFLEKNDIQELLYLKQVPNFSPTLYICQTSQLLCRLMNKTTPYPLRRPASELKYPAVNTKRTSPLAGINSQSSKEELEQEPVDCSTPTILGMGTSDIEQICKEAFDIFGHHFLRLHVPGKTLAAKLLNSDYLGCPDSPIG